MQRGEHNRVQRLEVRGAEGRQVIYSLSVIHRVPGFLSSRPNWVPHPLIHKEVLLLPPLEPGGETHSLAGLGGEANSEEGTDSLALYL